MATLDVVSRKIFLRTPALRERHIEFYSVGKRNAGAGGGLQGIREWPIDNRPQVSNLPHTEPMIRCALSLVGEAELEFETAVAGGFGEAFAVRRAGELVRLTEQR